MILKTAIEAHIHAYGTESSGFSIAPQFTKMVSSSITSNDWIMRRSLVYNYINSCF